MVKKKQEGGQSLDVVASLGLMDDMVEGILADKILNSDTAYRLARRWASLKGKILRPKEGRVVHTQALDRTQVVLWLADKILEMYAALGKMPDDAQQAMIKQEKLTRVMVPMLVEAIHQADAIFSVLPHPPAQYPDLVTSLLAGQHGANTDEDDPG